MGKFDVLGKVNFTLKWIPFPKIKEKKNTRLEFLISLLAV